MGAVDDELAVVDPELKVIGISNVRVVDASVFPLMVSANPMLTVGLLHPLFSFAEVEGGVAEGGAQLLTLLARYRSSSSERRRRTSSWPNTTRRRRGPPARGCRAIAGA